MHPGAAASPELVSIIIPTFNEAAGIGELVAYLRQHAEGPVEIVVADGSSPDGTAEVAHHAGARVLRCPRKGRAAQLNHGAAAAAGAILYFLHADTYPPPGFLAAVRAAVAAGAGSGCFRLRFDSQHWFLRLNAWFTRFDVDAIRFGDQSLFVRRAVFEQAGGYRPELVVMEDQEIVGRLRRHGPFRVLPQAVTTSARKYHENGAFRLQAVFTLIAVLHWLGVPQERLVRLYRRLIRQNKV
ncbi:TIGR04283 family arsenosugar biosynthesis glycosyltransferase [Hymenobacter weizhouensis]|uniref:TIGR04283 family arsenosugar biosynthesis glycosyltransferase n=1 Tax=Hymenobacter sp. YIM 151500-1 TaxID=2987689 RepID=UPI0022271807|nr:TIGR04283 family arsenosugar biosynthesis glycosyltransferase [Hymenobacter sp. YIM 151500-1]UYZ64245.1 TIGR04283 family arsenosugar biosynthesis glycosyltransferase [Hymenobacter sp. YIM 151500-1]